MPEAPAAPSTALERRDSSAQLILSDDEMRRTYRLAESMFLSGMFKDIRKAEAAFAKIVIGRDLGLTPAQSMQGIHIVEGGVQLHYSTLGAFVRQREGYDYRAGWLKADVLAMVEGEPEPCPVLDSDDEGATTVRLQTGEVVSVLNARTYTVPVVVWFDEEDPVDLRRVIGAVVQFTVDGNVRGLSRFTEDDARQAKLIKDSDKAAWNTSRRNMLLARAMSNGVKWFVPEVMGGMPVYTPGEIPVRESVTAPVGGGTDEGSGVDLGPKVDAVIGRATELGHAGLSNRAAIEIALGNRAPAVVNEWVDRARQELDSFAQRKAEEEPVDAVVVDDDGGVEDSIAVEVNPEPVDLAEPQEGDTPDVTVLRNRLRTLRGMQDSDLDAESQEQLNEETAHVEQQLTGADKGEE